MSTPASPASSGAPTPLLLAPSPSPSLSSGMVGRAPSLSSPPSIVRLNARKDNYIYAICANNNTTIIVVDPGEEAPVLALCEMLGATVAAVVLTHHHVDHLEAVPALVARFGCLVMAPPSVAALMGVQAVVRGGESLGPADGLPVALEVLAVPGHTRDHVAYVLPDPAAVFCGDALFALGCGRMFEGTPEMFWQSLSRLRQLSPETLVCCAHEYTASNARFALSLEPDNAGLAAYAERLLALTEQGLPTVPVLLAEECAYNPFLRADEPQLQRALGMEGAAPAAVFAAVRGRKDLF